MPCKHIMGGIMSLGTNLTTLRRLKSWTQGQLSEASGVKVGHISKLERDDDSDPKLSTIYKLMNALGCSADELLMDKERVGPAGQMQGVFRRAEELPEEKQAIVVDLVDAYCMAHALQSLMGDKMMLPAPWPFQRKAKSGA